MEVKVNATRDQLNEFKKSILWQDIRRELFIWKRGFELEYKTIVDNAAENNPSTASVLLHIGDISGRTKAVDYLMSLPDIFLGILEGQKDDASRERTE